MNLKTEFYMKKINISLLIYICCNIIIYIIFNLRNDIYLDIKYGMPSNLLLKIYTLYILYVKEKIVFDKVESYLLLKNELIIRYGSLKKYQFLLKYELLKTIIIVTLVDVTLDISLYQCYYIYNYIIFAFILFITFYFFRNKDNALLISFLSMVVLRVLN